MQRPDAGVGDHGLVGPVPRGLFGEIISWKLRLFVPVGERGKAIFERLTDRWPLTEIVDRG
jgi:hypothetical protein